MIEIKAHTRQRNTAPRSHLLRTTFRIAVRLDSIELGSGTCFLFRYKGKTWALTALHLFEPANETAMSFKEAYLDKVKQNTSTPYTLHIDHYNIHGKVIPYPLRYDKVIHSKELDITAIKIKDDSFCKEHLNDIVELDLDGVFFGKEFGVLSFPLEYKEEHYSRMPNSEWDFPLPFYTTGILSAANKKHFIITTAINVGASGGMVFMNVEMLNKEDNNKSTAQIPIGVVTSFLNPEPTYSLKMFDERLTLVVPVPKILPLLEEDT